MYILDDNLKPAPDGQEGEICISGTVLARGYHNMPDKTAEAFVRNPFAPEERLYKTGDLGIKLPNGSFDCKGRKDLQVKIRGLRIELEEIEAVLSQHQDVQKCVVEVRRSPSSSKVLVAYLTLKTNKPEIISELQKLAAKYLPDYMRPAAFTVLQNMPVTTHGKVDRRALPEPQFSASNGGEPTTATETILSAIWSSLLNLKQPGREDNFFLCGGHSLLAAALCIQIEKHFGVRLKIQDAFENPTIKAMSALLDLTLKSQVPAKKLKRISGKRNWLPASIMQENMWKQEKSSTKGNLFNIPILISLNGHIHINHLKQAFKAIVAENENLRTTIVFKDNTLQQHIHKFNEIHIPTEDISEQEGDNRTLQMNSIIEHEILKTFDFEKGPLFNCLIIKLSESEHKLLFVVHHLIFDGWSASLFFKELAEKYSALESGQELTITEKELQYADFALWQKRHLGSGVMELQLEYWKEKLFNAPPVPQMPFAQEPETGESGHARRHYFKIPKDLTSDLKSLSQDTGTTLFMVLTALLQVQINKYTGAVDITTGTATANRPIAGTENIQGLFINALPLRNQLDMTDSFKDFLLQVKKTTLAAFDNQDTPYSKVLSQSQLHVKHQKPLFSTSLILQNLPWPEMEFSDIKMSYDELGSGTAKVDIMITLEERHGELHGWFEYRANIFNPESIRDMEEGFTNLARQIVNAPETTLKKFDCQLPMHSKTTSCFIVGETGMASACGEILRNKGFYINGIFSTDQIVVEWGQNANIPVHNPSMTNMHEILSAIEFDYLFSIINSFVIPEDILELPRKAAINYHDSPLPRYAGLYATAWALINQEKSHAITWHRMSSEIDTGEIYKQKTVTLQADDSSGSLNIKCTEKGIDALDELADELLADRAETTPQDFSERSYYGMLKRPPNACILDWNQSPAELSALGRALNFGNTENNIGTPKIWYNNSFYTVKNVLIRQKLRTSARPGTILESFEDYITVAAKDGAVKLSGIHTLKGQLITGERFKTGDVMELNNLNLPHIDTLYKSLARTEMFWVHRLKNLKQPELPLVYPIDQEESPESIELSSHGLNFDPVVTFAIFISRLTCMSDFDLPYSPEIEADDITRKLFLWDLPLNISVKMSDSAINNLKNIEKQRAYTRQQITCMADLGQRFKDIKFFKHFPFSLRRRNNIVYLRPTKGTECAPLLERYRIFCDNLKSALDSPLREIPLITGSEREKQLDNWNKTAWPFDLNQPYHKFFTSKVELFGNSTAVKFNNALLSYKQLDKLSNRIAHLLISTGANHGQPICVLAERCLELAPVILGILKAGCAYLPLEPNRYPKERIHHIVDDADCEVIINLCPGTAKWADDFMNIKMLDLSKGLESIFTQPETLPEIEVAPEATAYIIYTSGSTGMPKGVMVSHKNLLNHNFGVLEDYGIHSEDNVLQFGALGFDLSLEEIFPTWLAGAKLVLLPPKILENPEKFLNFVNKENITVLDLPTAYWHELVTAIRNIKLPESVRLTIIGGEKVSAEHCRRWRELTGDVRLINTYGPTETTIIATLGENPSTIGRPCANTYAYILDPLLQPVPQGMPGELCIGGLCVSKGYLNRPVKTAEVFVENPFIPGEKIYKTGDIAKFTPEGEIVFLGRRDNQVKLRGYRIELGDIEAVLKDHPSVENSVVILRKERTVKNLAGYFVPSGENFSVPEILEFLKSKLPEYMIPLTLTAISSIPLTPNGKVNHAALPPPVEHLENNNRITDTALPSCPMEIQIAQLFQNLLGIRNFDHNASFFDLGGDSLTAIRLSLELEKTTGHKISVENLYRAPSVKAFCRYLEHSSEKRMEWNSLVTLSSGGKRPPLYLIHTTPGDILGYVNLVRYIIDRPVFGIQAYGLSPRNKPHSTIREMAEYYNSLLIENDPQGPYFLCGWCFGGILAFEMARLMKLQGREVGFLGLIETWGRPQRTLKYLFKKFCNLACWGVKGWLQYSKAKTSFMKNIKKHTIDLDFIAKRFSDSRSKQEIARLKNIYNINLEAALNFYMDYYHGKIDLFKINDNEQATLIPDKHLYWDGLCDVLVQHEVPGSHRTVLKEPNVEYVAEKLIECMLEAEKKSVIVSKNRKS
jgi:amino acid adenylation domain-containing protein